MQFLFAFGSKFAKYAVIGTNVTSDMTANISISLTECLTPNEVGTLLDIAKEDRRPVDDEVVFALREYIERRRKPTSPTPAQSAPFSAAA